MIKHESLEIHQQKAFDLYKGNSPFDGEQCFAHHLNKQLREGVKLKPKWEVIAQNLESIRELDNSEIERVLFRATFDDYV